MIILSHWFFLALDLVTTFVDVLLIVVNRRRLTRVSPQYSLSRTYQINENVLVTTGMIVPTDLCNAGLFIVCLTISTTIRYSMDSWPQHRFASVYDGLYSLLLIQAITSLAIFIHFCNRAKKTARVIEQRSESDLYFELFKKQIAESEKLCMNHH
ncbi:hypothetical protein AAVH_27895 [Aphelenchoides avenae]|nr:hypothetical protein AAVH_27894 [Aphelenchus avenae]KAH7704907.1 hypothetical protein AAVH_27895 [Aphelenchus avenae]